MAEIRNFGRIPTPYHDRRINLESRRGQLGSEYRALTLIVNVAKRLDLLGLAGPVFVIELEDRIMRGEAIIGWCGRWLYAAGLTGLRRGHQRCNGKCDFARIEPELLQSCRESRRELVFKAVARGRSSRRDNRRVGVGCYWRDATE